MQDDGIPYWKDEKRKKRIEKICKLIEEYNTAEVGDINGR